MGGPEKWQKMGESQTGSVSFLSRSKKWPWALLGKAPLSLNLFREIFFEFHHVYSQSMSDWFSAHVRPVVHVIIFACFSIMCTIYIIL